MVSNKLSSHKVQAIKNSFLHVKWKALNFVWTAGGGEWVEIENILHFYSQWS